MKLKSAQSDYHGGQINIIRRIAYWYCDTYIREQGLHFSPPYKKISSLKFQFRSENNIFNPKAEMLQVHDTSAAHSDIYKELGMEK